MIIFDNVTNETKTEYNSKQPYIPDHSYSSGKTNILCNLTEYQNDYDNGTDKIYLHAKDPYEAQYQFLINRHKKLGLDNFHDPKAFLEYSNDTQKYKYKNIKEYNPDKDRRALIVFDIIAHMISNRKLNQIVIVHQTIYQRQKP